MSDGFAEDATFDLHMSKSAPGWCRLQGYAMLPVQYALGVMKEQHLHTREKAGLFDVSHMGQVNLKGADYAARDLEPGAGRS